MFPPKSSAFWQAFAQGPWRDAFAFDFNAPSVQPWDRSGAVPHPAFDPQDCYPSLFLWPGHSWAGLLFRFARLWQASAYRVSRRADANNFHFPFSNNPLWL